MKPRRSRGLSVSLPFRTVIFWLHLAPGLVAGIVILIMSVTGVLLMYERQITEWADRGYRRRAARARSRAPPGGVPARPACSRRGPGASRPSLTLQSDPAAPAAVGLGRGRNLYRRTPTRARSSARDRRRSRAFFRAVTDWHRWLGAGGRERDAGRAVTGACNLAFLFLVVSGLYLWLPRKWTAAPGAGTWPGSGAALAARRATSTGTT